MSRSLLVLTVLCALSAPVMAQAPNIQSYNLLVFAAGVDPTTGGQPIQNTPVPATAVTCNQPVITPGTSVINPTTIEFDDAANAGQVCLINLNLMTSFLVPLPIATGYTVRMTQTDINGQVSGLSLPSNPFDVVGSPATITNVRVLRK